MGKCRQLQEVLKLVALLPPPIPKSNKETNHESNLAQSIVVFGVAALIAFGIQRWCA